MSDPNKRRVGEFSVEGLQDALLGDGVDGAQAIVEQENFGPAGETTGQGEALFLSPRESHSPLADARVESFRETSHVFIHRGKF